MDVALFDIGLFNKLSARLAASIEELQRQRTSVLQLNQLKNDLIAVLAHDIKGPLTSIVGFAELLEEGYLEGDAATDAARTIRSNAQRLATLANDVLALSRVEHGELEIADERVDLIKLLQEAIHAHASERDISLHHDVAEAFVRGDSERLRQVFDNLLRNAIKYSPNGEPIRIDMRRDGESYIASVTDRGIGIPEDERERLFDRFSRGSNARRAKISGTGIGLFIVKMIVERHGGGVGVESKVGEGSRFDVRLPRIDAADSLRPMRVTLLSADATLSRFAAYELRRRGYRVREASSLAEAAGGDLRTGDVVVVDDGVAPIADIRNSIPDGISARVVGLGEPSEDGWDATLPKPFLVTDLLRAIDSPADRLVRQ
ncbi:MAG: HAMP domain-containing histidine kinase [Candidatus Eremiobacteraeota bacterium]|nr:HAMP domain-containing histidine kinase [Candidatus Eremiobacteraeota bacterium]